MTPTVPSGSAGAAATVSSTCCLGRARGRHRLGQGWREEGGCPLVVPASRDQELLEGSHGGACLQGNGFDRLAWQIGQQPSAVGVEMGGCALLEEAVTVTPQVSSESRSQAGDFLFCHRIPSR